MESWNDARATVSFVSGALRCGDQLMHQNPGPTTHTTSMGRMGKFPKIGDLNIVPYIVGSLL